MHPVYHFWIAFRHKRKLRTVNHRGRPKYEGPALANRLNQVTLCLLYRYWPLAFSLKRSGLLIKLVCSRALCSLHIGSVSIKSNFWPCQQLINVRIVVRHVGIVQPLSSPFLGWCRTRQTNSMNGDLVICGKSIVDDTATADNSHFYFSILDAEKVGVRPTVRVRRRLPLGV